MSESKKGDAITKAHIVLDAGSEFAAVHKAASAMREREGGKDAPKYVQQGYKLAKRFATVAEFLEKNGLSFKNVGEVIGEKKSLSINLVESFMRTESDNVAQAAAAKAFQETKGSLIARVTAAEKAAQNAEAEQKAQALQAARQAMRNELMAELAEEKKAKTRVSAK